MIGNRALLAFALLLAPSIAFADGTSDQALAQSLFDEGVRLMEQGKYADACPKLAESQRLDPGGGTLLNLGLCREKEGKLASAWSVYNTALSLAIKDGRKDRELTARERVTALEPTLAKIVINVPEEIAKLRDLEVMLDGVRIGRAAWSLPTPIDVGNHVMTVSATDKRTWQQTVDVDHDSQVVNVTVPSLEDAPQDRHPDAAPKPSPLRPIGLAVGGVGAAGIVLGTIGGVMAIVKRSDSNKECPGGTGANMCSVKGVAANEDAKTFAWVANIGFGVGIVGLTVGTILFFMGKPQPQQRAWIAPVIGPDGASLVGRF